MNVYLNVPFAEALHLRLVQMSNEISAKKGEHSAALAAHTKKLASMILDFSIFEGFEGEQENASFSDLILKRMDYLTRDNEGWVLKRGLQHSCGTDNRLDGIDFEAAIGGLIASGDIEMQRRRRIGETSSRGQMAIQLRKIQKGDAA